MTNIDQTTRGPKIRHLGIACSSAKNARNFYGGILGLKQDRSMTLPADLSQTLFGVAEEIQTINFLGGDLHVEVFIRPGTKSAGLAIGHICMEVDDMDMVLVACQAMGLPVIRADKPEGRPR